jgi:predicted transcriptional regulator
MTALTIRLPDSVHRRIKELAARDGVSVNQFIASAAAEKMASVMTLDYLRAEAAQGRREDFLAVLGSAPDVPPQAGDEPPPHALGQSTA